MQHPVAPAQSLPKIDLEELNIRTLIRISDRCCQLGLAVGVDEDPEALALRKVQYLTKVISIWYGRSLVKSVYRWLKQMSHQCPLPFGYLYIILHDHILVFPSRVGRSEFLVSGGPGCWGLLALWEYLRPWLKYYC